MTARTPELDAAVRAVGWPELLPGHRADGDDLPAGVPVCLDALPLRAGLTLAVLADDRGRTYPVPLITEGDGVRRARPGDGAAEALVDVLTRGSHEIGRWALTVWHGEHAAGERPIAVDQTNQSVVVGDRAVVKWVFHAEQGPHPAPSLLAELGRRRFRGTPRPWGVLEWRPDGGEPRLVASVVALLPGAEDGWTWVVDDLRSAVTTDDESLVTAAGTCLGELIGSLHGALADTAQPATADDVSQWCDEAVADLEHALSITHGSPHEVLASSAGAVRSRLAELADHVGTPVIRVHGDLHVGQVLRAGPAYLVTDFDGNPVVPPAERLRRQPPALDVAGMAQSIRHAALVLRRHEPAHDLTATRRMAEKCISAFVLAYRSTLAEARLSHLYEPALVRPLCLRQVCREFTYAATHLPRWSYVPEAALPDLLQEGHTS